MQTTTEFQLRQDHRDTLKRWPRRPTTPSAQARRACILLAVDAGRSATDTATLLHVSRSTVHLWHRRYLAEGLAGLVDRARSGRPTVLDRRTVERILFLTSERVPGTDGGNRLEYAADGSLRRRHPVAGAAGLAGRRRQAASAQDLCTCGRLHNFTPTSACKLSHDPQFAEKVIDAVGLYLNPTRQRTGGTQLSVGAASMWRD